MPYAVTSRAALGLPSIHPLPLLHGFLTVCFKIGWFICLFVLPEKNAINISDFMFSSAEGLQIL